MLSWHLESEKVYEGYGNFHELPSFYFRRPEERATPVDWQDLVDRLNEYEKAFDEIYGCDEGWVNDLIEGLSR